MEKKEKKKKRRKKVSLNNMNRKRVKTVLSFIILVLWICFIFRNSSEVAEVSSQRSGALAAFLMNIISEHMLRKMAHLFEYTVLGILLKNLIDCFTISISEKNRIDKIKVFKIIIPAIAGAVIASLDEFIQFNTDGRSAQISDVVLDFVGVLAGIVILCLFYKLIQFVNVKKTHISD